MHELAGEEEERVHGPEPAVTCRSRARLHDSSDERPPSPAAAGSLPAGTCTSTQRKNAHLPGAALQHPPPPRPLRHCHRARKGSFLLNPNEEYELKTPQKFSHIYSFIQLIFIFIELGLDIALLMLYISFTYFSYLFCLLEIYLLYPQEEYEPKAPEKVSKYLFIYSVD